MEQCSKCEPNIGSANICVSIHLERILEHVDGAHRSMKHNKYNRNTAGTMRRSNFHLMRRSSSAVQSTVNSFSLECAIPTGMNDFSAWFAIFGMS